MSVKPIGPKPPRPEAPSKHDGRIADPAARAASARAAASGLSGHSGRVWRTFHFVYEELVTHGRWRGTFTILGTTAAMLGKPASGVYGWERDDLVEDLATLERLGVLWYWPATGRGKGRWAMVEFPPTEPVHEKAATPRHERSVDCPDHGADAGCHFNPGTGWGHGAAVSR